MKPRGAPLAGCLLAAFAAALALWCRTHPPPSLLAVEFAGCAATLFPGPVCVLDEKRNLVLWVPKPSDTETEIRADERLLASKGDSIGEGFRYRVVIPPGAAEVKVENSGPGSVRAIWSLMVSGPRAPAADEHDVQEEIKLGTRGTYQNTGNGTFDRIQRLELNEARESLKDLEALAPLPRLSLESRYRLAYGLALLADREGDFRTAMTQLDLAIEKAEHGALTVFYWNAMQKHALVLANLGRSREAAEEFAQIAKTAQFENPCVEGRFLSNWAWASLLAHEAGDVREVASLESPEKLLERAIEKIRSDPERCDSKAVLNARLNLVLAHLQAGLPELATRELVSARQAKTESTLFLQLWELDLDARIELARARPKLALGIYRQLDRIAQAVGSPDGRLRAALGLARATDQLGDREGALAILAAAEELLKGQSLQVPLYDGRQTFVSQREGVASLEVQLLLHAGRNSEALAAARRGRSRVLRQLDLSERVAGLSPGDKAKWSDEILKYTRARGEIDQAVHQEWSLLADEVATERAAREKKARETAETLERAIAILGEPPPLRLAPVAPGELMLAFHPLPRGPRNPEGDWVAFATDGSQKTSVHPFTLASALASDAALAREILLPFREQILGAERIRILPYGPLRDIDFQALPFGDDILLSANPVVYALDLSPASGIPAQGGERQALVVANPSGNLPGSIAEAKAVEKAILSWASGWQVERLEESTAEADKVRTELGRVELFHFSGHGRFAGLGGSDSNLLLAADRRLTVGEVLVLAHTPRWVLLSGCETGRAAPEARVEGLGLANAFILAGTHAVVASVRSVDDRSAEQLFADLYRRWHGDADLARALQQALLAWRSRNPEADWKSFRLIEP